MPEADLHELAERYRPEFPVFRSAIYLNTCSLGALSQRGRAALDRFADLWDRRGAAAWYEHWLDAAQDVRASFARLISVDEEETALAASISAALASIVSAIDLEARPGGRDGRTRLPHRRLPEALSALSTPTNLRAKFPSMPGTSTSTPCSAGR